MQYWHIAYWNIYKTLESQCGRTQCTKVFKTRVVKINAWAFCFMLSWFINLPLTKLAIQANETKSRFHFMALTHAMASKMALEARIILISKIIDRRFTSQDERLNVHRPQQFRSRRETSFSTDEFYMMVELFKLDDHCWMLILTCYRVSAVI